MQAPQKISAEQFTAELLEARDRDGKCTCGFPYMYVIVHVSIHATEFEDCTGEGRCYPVLLPYCRKCEQEPQRSGCVHLPLFEKYGILN
jgi:hypothetical protein